MAAVSGTAIADFVAVLPRHRTVFHTVIDAEIDRVGQALVVELDLRWGFTGSDNVLADYLAAVPDSVQVAGIGA
jgi:hypothetical protein